MRVGLGFVRVRVGLGKAGVNTVFIYFVYEGGGGDVGDGGFITSIPLLGGGRGRGAKGLYTSYLV